MFIRWIRILARGRRNCDTDGRDTSLRHKQTKTRGHVGNCCGRLLNSIHIIKQKYVYCIECTSYYIAYVCH